MNRHDALERELTAWFVDTAVPRTPDYTTDIVELTATLRQRPRWTFLERWLPMSVITLARRSFRPIPWRAVAILAALVLLLTAVAVFVGSQQRLPAPFGVAANGLVAYAKDGDIFTVDPATGSRRSITSGADVDERPLWSLDGTRLAFLRVLRPWSNDGTVAGIHVVVVVDTAGKVIATTTPIEGIDGVAWSPDGRWLVLSAAPSEKPGALYKIDAADGGLLSLETGYTGLDFYWRPAHQSQLLFLGELPDGDGLVVADVDDPTSAKLVAPAARGEVVRPNGWTSGGERVVYTRGRADVNGELDPTTARVHVLDLATKGEVVIDAEAAHVSNDGTRLVAVDDSGEPCIASIDGGSCIAIGDTSQAYHWGDAKGAQWAPDDEWIVVHTDGDRTVLLDPTGGTGDQPSWVVDGAESWQRRAP